jgi:hypothetical protein
LQHHTPLQCFSGRAKVFTLPNGTAMAQESSNPYCKRTEREVDDWWSLSMAFTANTKVEQNPLCITWQLSVQYLGQELTMPGLQTGGAWVAVEGYRKYYQYNVVREHNVIEPDIDTVDLNEFQ